MFKTIEMYHQGRVSAMPAAETMLTGGKDLMDFPEIDNLPDVYPDSEFTEHFQEHEWAEAVQGNPICRIFGLGA